MLFDLSIRGLGLLNYENDQVSGESFFLKKVLARYERPLVLDVGANHGNYAEKVIQMRPEATLYAFEPHPATFVTLKQLAQKCGFEAVNCGMGAETGTMKLYDREQAYFGAEHATLYREVIEDIHHSAATSQDVEINTIDSFLVERHISRVTLLKIDTEGHEYQVLLGARQTLAEGRIDLVQIEFNEMNVVSKVFYRDIIALLGEGYDAYRLLPNGLLPLKNYRPRLCELFAFQNLLFVRRTRSESGGN
jgi:FkbM family methyltransferase